MTDQANASPGVELVRVRPASTPAGHGWFLAVRDYAAASVVAGHAASGNVAEVVGWDVLPGVEDAARSKLLRYQGGSFQLIGMVKDGEWAPWALPCSQPLVPEMPPAPGAN